MRPSCPTPTITTVAITATASTTGQTRGNYLITAPGELPDRRHLGRVPRRWAHLLSRLCGADRRGLASLRLRERSGGLPRRHVCTGQRSTAGGGPRYPRRLRILLAGLSDFPTDERALFGYKMRVWVSRQAVAEVISSIARVVALQHETGRIHGDVKPHNVLVPDRGPMLIDSFDIEAGQPSPGWTPNWSAPEQMLGQPISPAADVYGLAMMLARLLGGQLVGEIHRYPHGRRRHRPTRVRPRSRPRALHRSRHRGRPHPRGYARGATWSSGRCRSTRPAGQPRQQNSPTRSTP